MSIEIGKETLGEFLNGHKTVGVSRVRLTTISFSLNKGVLIRAPGTSDPAPNGAPVWVGGASVTADSHESSGGMPIPPGEGLFIPIDDPSKLWLISTMASQDVSWLGM